METPLSPNAVLPTTSGKVQKISTSFLTMLNGFSALRAQQVKNYRYAVGDMIDKDIRKKLDEDKRPALVFQLTQPILNFISGTLKKDRKKMKADPIRMGDEDLTDLHTIMGDWAMDNCDGYDEYSKASLDAAIAKIGWMNFFWTYRNTTEGKLIARAEDPLSIVFDMDGKKIDQSDWRFLAKHGMYTTQENILTYQQYLTPDLIKQMQERAAEIEGVYKKDLEGKPIGYYQRTITFNRFVAEQAGVDLGPDLINSFMDVRYGLYRTIEWHDRRQIEKRAIYSPINGQSEPIPDNLLSEDKKTEYDQFVTASKQRVPEGREKINIVEQLWMCATIPALLPDEPIFEMPYAVQERGFQYKPIFWYDYHPDLLQTTSLVDAMISPNDLFNQRQMTQLELLMKELNQDTTYPLGSIPPAELEIWKSKQKGKLKGYNVVGGGKPEKEMGVSAGAYQMSQTMAEEMKSLIPLITNITPNLTGLSETSNEPASLFQARVEQGMVTLAHPFANIYKTMKYGFGYCDATLQKFMTTERMIRLFDEPPEGLQGVQQQGQTSWLMINQQTLQGVKNDLTQGEYDFRVDVASPGQTEKRVNAMLMLQLAETMAQAGFPQGILWPIVIQAQDFPDAKKWAAFVTQMLQMQMGQMQQGQQAQQQQQQLQMQSAQAQIAQQHMDLLEKGQSVHQNEQFPPNKPQPKAKAA